MKITMITAYELEVGNADGIRDYSGQDGETVDFPAEIAAMFLASGAARPADAESATRAKGEKATRS